MIRIKVKPHLLLLWRRVLKETIRYPMHQKANPIHQIKINK
jgi:hypothetical protein